MAYTCSWSCVSDTVIVPTVTTIMQQPSSSANMQQNSLPTMTIAAALAGQKVVDDSPFPTSCIKGDALSIKIYQEEYHRGLEDCKNVLRARLTLNKGDKPYFARDLSNKIGKVWKTSAGWKMVPLGKGYYDFHFDSADDLRKIWPAGTVNLKLGLLRFSQWTKDFKYLLPQEYWRERILKEITSAVDCCSRGSPPKPTRQNNNNKDVGDSMLAIGSTWTRVPVPVASTVTTTQRVLVSDMSTPTSFAPTSLAIPASFPAPTLTFNSQMGSVVTSTSANSQMDMSLSSNTFSFPLHNVFDKISPGEFPHTMQVLEVVSPAAHVDVHSESAEQLHLTSREVLENPTMDDVSGLLSDEVDHNRSSPKELEESPKGSIESAPHSSHVVEHQEVHEGSVESMQVQTDIVVEHDDVHAGSHALKSLVVVEPPSVVSGSIHTAKEQDVVILQKQEVHPSKNIHHGLDLWARV
ncbi:DUF4283 domain protein [Medicago truncatula]|uniref:DUF4283 domain protein n=1 Tax=Medicago truncatula TaxID=3880 RepID=G7L584_MEDTR|nr:DUF4283 domain protein [Medicago truncatula]